MKRLGTLAAILSLAATGMAQLNDATPNNVAFRLGGVYVLDDGTRNVTKTMIGVGLDYFLPISVLRSQEAFVSIDWFGKSASGAKGNIFPIMFNLRYYPSQADEGGRSYFHFGVGGVVLDVTNTKTTLGGRAGFGYEFTRNVFSELNWVFSDKVSGAKADSLSVYVGYRF